MSISNFPIKSTRPADLSRIETLRKQPDAEAALRTELPNMESMDGVFRENLEELIQALVKPANRDLPANAITRTFYIDHLDLGSMGGPAAQPKVTLTTPEHQSAPMLSSISLPGEIPITTAELATYAATNPTSAEALVVLDAAMHGPLGENIQNMTQVLQHAMPAGGSKAEQTAQSQILEQLLHKAKEQVDNGADPIGARVEIQDWNANLRGKFNNESDIRLAWAITRLANIIVKDIE